MYDPIEEHCGDKCPIQQGIGLDASVKKLIEQAEAGDTDAQTDLAVAYEYGIGVPQSDELADKYYRMVEDANNEKPL